MTEVSIGSYRLHETLGGARRTFVASRADTDQRFAVKLFPHDGKSFDTEIARAAVWNATANPRICQVQEVGFTRGSAYAAAPLLDGCDLRHVIKAVGIQRSQTAGPGHIPIAIGMMAEFARATDAVSGGFADLMQPGFLLPEHLFVTWSGECMALDPRWVALSEWASSGKGQLQHALAYTLPAHLLPEVRHEEALVRALGIMTWELLTGYRLFRSTSLIGALRRLHAVQVPEACTFNRSIDPALSSWLGLLITEPAGRRLTEMAEALSAAAGSCASPEAIAQWLAQVVPRQNETPKASGLELFLGGAQAEWLTPEDSTTFMLSIPSPSLADGLDGLEWLEADGRRTMQTEPPPCDGAPRGPWSIRRTARKLAATSVALAAAGLIVYWLSVADRRPAPAPRRATLSTAAGGRLIAGMPGSMMNDSIDIDDLQDTWVDSGRTEVRDTSPVRIGPGSDFRTSLLPWSEVIVRAPPLATVTEAGQILGVGTFRIRLAPGDHRFIVTPWAGQSAEATAALSAGKVHVLDFYLAPSGQSDDSFPGSTSAWPQ